MSDEKETKTPDNPDAEDSGKESDQEAQVDFTPEQQKHIDDIIKTRMARKDAQVAKQYANVPELKEKADRLDEIDEAQKTETEKLQTKLDTEIVAREAAEAKAERTLIASKFIAVASQAGVKHPEDAFALADKELIIVEEGKVTGVEAAVKLLVDNGRLPLMSKPPAPSLDGGAGENNRSGDATKLTPEQKDAAVKMGVPLDEYAKILQTKE